MTTTQSDVRQSAHDIFELAKRSNPEHVWPEFFRILFEECWQVSPEQGVKEMTEFIGRFYSDAPSFIDSGELDEAKERISELEYEVRDLESEAEEIDDLKSAIDDLESERDSLVDERDELRIEVDNLESKINQLESTESC